MHLEEAELLKKILEDHNSYTDLTEVYMELDTDIHIEEIGYLQLLTQTQEELIQ